MTVVVFYNQAAFQHLASCISPALADVSVRMQDHAPNSSQPTGDMPQASEHACAGGSVTALRLAFFDAFTMFAIAAQTLGEAADEGSPPESPGGPPVPTTRRLLVLMSNCQHVRSSLLPALADKYAPERCLEVCEAQGALSSRA